MARLESTRSIVSKNLKTATNLLLRTDAAITSDYHKINILRGSIKRASRPQTLKAIQLRTELLAKEMGHSLPIKANKSYLLYKLKTYIKQNTFLRFAAVRQSTINICAIYEDFIHRIIMKYFEENIRRIPDKKESMKNKDLIVSILRGDNMHHTLAQKVTDDLMYGSIEKWNKELARMGMVLPALDNLKELFLIRNCMIHNNNKVSHELYLFNPSKYQHRDTIRLGIPDVLNFKKEVDSYILAVIAEYNRLFPVNGGSWINR